MTRYRYVPSECCPFCLQSLWSGSSGCACRLPSPVTMKLRTIGEPDSYTSQPPWEKTFVRRRDLYHWIRGLKFHADLAKRTLAEGWTFPIQVSVGSSSYDCWGTQLRDERELLAWQLECDNQREYGELLLDQADELGTN